MRASYGVSFVSSKSNLCPAEVIAVLYVISWYIGPRYNGTRLYKELIIGRFAVIKRFEVYRVTISNYTQVIRSNLITNGLLNDSFLFGVWDEGIIKIIYTNTDLNIHLWLCNNVIYFQTTVNKKISRETFLSVLKSSVTTFCYVGSSFHSNLS